MTTGPPGTFPVSRWANPPLSLQLETCDNDIIHESSSIINPTDQIVGGQHFNTTETCDNDTIHESSSIINPTDQIVGGQHFNTTETCDNDTIHESSSIINSNSTDQIVGCQHIPSAEESETRGIFDSLENDPANYIKIQKWTPELKNLILMRGAYQPNENDLPNGEYPKDSNNKRSFHSSWYFRKLLDMTYIKRDWLTYSLKLNKVFCLYCILYGNSENSSWTTYGYSYWKNGLMAIVKHETSSAHVMSSLKIKLKESCLPLVPSIIEERNRQVAFNREVVKQLIEITIFLARHNLSFRGHHESWESDIKGNFKDIVILLAHHSPVLSVHINQLKSKGRKESSFITWDRQNLLIESIAEYILSVIKTQIMSAQYFSICIDSTFDVSHKEQLSFIVRYLFHDKIHERLIALTESPCTTGEALFDQFKLVMEKSNLDWKNKLVGQSYDGAANMRGSYSGLQSRIIDINPKAL
ncbi:uncharacterized protein LOC114127771 isoform X1 [Aphis gossypii]|uniref:uncharacterized protein LOC114127771 isoform X1 n=1 Tax=Aphis gossypii TaxID=80765 RepID=UPI002158AEFC|nr:uncharacterized protein LOC114127771 isoform X1 [Aphis gossypii]